MRSSLINKLTWEDIKEIHEILDNMEEELTDEEVKFNSVLKKLKRKYKVSPTCKERYSALLPVAEKLVGAKLGDKRTPEQMLIRLMVSCRLYDEQYTISEIGRVIGRDHSTIMYYIKRRDDYFSVPTMYTYEVSLLERFKDSIETDGRDNPN